MGNAKRAVTRLLAALAAVVVTATGLVTVQSESAAALNASDFDPGYIISDELFYDGNAMSSAEIQSFLDGKIGTCQTTRCLNVAVVPVTTQPATFTNGRLLCNAIAGGSMRVSELIYRVQVACGISAKVILVTLQKEQSLVTSRAPSDWALRAAMGMGCPDTAPCNDAFAGLANQIISGTRQLLIYKVAPFMRQPGVHYIQYHPNAACGGTNVNIRNHATAALYNYTPYQPNAAALANLYGTGDGCSSYGNRNFWRFYNDWFGSSIEFPCTKNPARDIAEYWQEQGGSNGPLGASVAPGIVVGAGGITVGSYAAGNIYCTPRVGPVAVVGDLNTKYVELGAGGSALGAPLSARSAFSAGGISGYLQEFQRGTMLSSGPTGTHPVLHGAIRTAWGARGGSGGSLGWPTGDPESVDGGTRQQFQNGLLAITPAGAAVVLDGAMATYWRSGSNAEALGSPTTNASAWTAGGVTGTLQYFTRGMVLSSASTGTHAVLSGPIRDLWGVAGGSGGSLGWPVAEQVSSAGGVEQRFQNGTVYATSSGSGGTVTGRIASYWTSGSNKTKLGYPTGSASPWSARGVNGTLQYFERGMVLSSDTTGTHAVLNGPMRDAWGARGGSGGTLGWPTGDQQTVGDELRQDFQGGRLTVRTGVTGPIGDYWATGANAALLGAPTSAATAYSAGGVSGTLQYFERGMVLSSAATGTFAVLNGKIRDAWGGAGGSGGSLGWPTGDQTATTGGITQRFQRGSVFVPTGGSGVLLTGPIGDYWATGANSTVLGAPTSSPTAYSAGGVSGTLQYFQRGLVLSSASTGTVAVLSGKIRDAWGLAGGSGGTMGWPTADQTSAPGGVVQRFQRGIVFTPTTGSAVLVSGAIGQYWVTGSNGSALGMPTGAATAYSAGGVSGTLQYFERGMVLSSAATGTHAVLTGPLRTAWGARDGSGGTLGWPTSDQETVETGTRQRFQRGTITITDTADVIVVEGAYFQYWSAGTNASKLGDAVASAVTWSAGGVTGSYQTFERGMVMSSATTGTFAVLNGPVRTVWGAQDGSGGPLGWPVADQVTTPNGVEQAFQHGRVIVPNTGDPYFVLG